MTISRCFLAFWGLNFSVPLVWVWTKWISDSGEVQFIWFLTGDRVLRIRKKMLTELDKRITSCIDNSIANSSIKLQIWIFFFWANFLINYIVCKHIILRRTKNVIKNPQTGSDLEVTIICNKFKKKSYTFRLSGTIWQASSVTKFLRALQNQHNKRKRKNEMEIRVTNEQWLAHRQMKQEVFFGLDCWALF